VLQFQHSGLHLFWEAAHLLAPSCLHALRCHTSTKFVAVCPPQRNTPVQAHISIFTILLYICSPPPGWAVFTLHTTGIQGRISFPRSLSDERHKSSSSRQSSNPYRNTVSFGPDGIPQSNSWVVGLRWAVISTVSSSPQVQPS